MRLSLCSLAGVLLFSAACNPKMVSGIDDGLGGPHEPGVTRAYATGTFLNLVPYDGHGAYMTGYSVSSSDPAVLATMVAPMLGAHDLTVTQARAVAAGTATLSVIETHTGHVVYEETVDVREPNGARFFTEHAVLPVATPAAMEVTSITMIPSDTATLSVVLYDGDTALRANVTLEDSTTSIATVGGGGGTGILAVQSLHVGSADVPVQFHGATIATLGVTVIPPSDVGSVVVDAPSEVGAKKGDLVWLTASAFDRDGNRLEGSSFAWTATGVGGHATGYGFSLPYEYVPTETLTLSTSFGTASTTTVVHGHVANAHDLVCSVSAVGAGGRPLPAVLLLSLALVGLGARRRSLRR